MNQVFLRKENYFFNDRFILALCEAAYPVIMNLEYFLHIFIILLPQWLDEWQMIMLALMVSISVKQNLNQTLFTLQITRRPHFNVIKGKALFSFSDCRFDLILSHKIAMLITGQLPR